MVAAKRKEFSHVLNIFGEVRPHLEEVLRRYEIPASDATTLLEETAMELAYKVEGLEDIAGWLIVKLRRRCRRYWVARRHAMTRAAGRFFSTQ